MNAVDLNDVIFVSSSIVLAVGESDGTRGVVLNSTDGGATWTQQLTVIPNEDLKKLAFNGGTTVLAVGNTGSIIRQDPPTPPVVRQIPIP